MNIKTNALLVAAAFAASAMGISSTYAAGDPFTGDYAGNCPGAQCYMEITKNGKGYVASFAALERMDASKVLCKAQIPLSRSKGALSGNHKGSQISVSPNKTGDIRIKTSATCGKFKMSGTFSEYGDY